MPGGIEQAIVRFATEGVSDVEAASDKITADLSSAQRAGVSAQRASEDASSAAKEAQREARHLAVEIRHTLHALHQAAELAKTIASAAGVDDLSTGGRALEAGVAALGGATRGARLGGLVGPEGAAIGALVGGLAAAVSSINETGKKLEERENRLAEIDQKENDNEIKRAVLREVGLSQADWIAGGGSRSVQ